ncbi:MAG: metallophosphoesterase [Anaerolineales bacterium]|nr:metallophosphoesterase [Anaerolineales bacterium]
MKRRDFLKWVTAVVASRRLVLGRAKATNALYFIIPPTTLHVGETTAMIGYWLSQTTDSGALHLFKDGQPVQIIPLPTDRAVVTLENLEPATTYTYRIEVGGEIPAYLDFAEAWGPLSFRTQPFEWPIRLAAIGDSGFGDSVTLQLAEHIAAHDIHAFLHLGDVAYNCYEHDNNLPLNWALKYYRPYQAILQRVPHYAVFGNHDRQSDTFWLDQPFYFWAFPSLNQGEAWHDQRRWYAVTLNDVRLVGLDTQCYYTDRCLGDQNNWLDQQLADTTPYRTNLVLFHIPFWTSGTVHAEDGLVIAQTWEQRLRDHADQIGVVLNGHSHLYERLYRGGVHYITSGGGGASIYGNSTPVAGSQVVRSLANYVIVEVYPDQIQVTAYDIDNTVIDQSSWAI